MKIGIIVAMRKELDLLLPLLEESEDSRMSGFEFHRGKIGSHDVMVMQCGIGKVNAAMGALMLVNHFAPHFVINSGVAGGADTSVNVMDVVAGARVAYHDVWCGPESEVGRVQGLPLYFEGAERLLNLLPERDDIHKGLICSGDQFIDKMEDVQRIKGNFPEALAVDMESGAIAAVCSCVAVKTRLPSSLTGSMTTIFALVASLLRSSPSGHNTNFTSVSSVKPSMLSGLTKN